MGKKIRNSDANDRRKDRILGCQQCKGAPPTKETNLQGLKTTYCDLCMEVINYTNEFAPVRTKETIIEKIEIGVQQDVDQRTGFDFLVGYKPNL